MSDLEDLIALCEIRKGRNLDKYVNHANPQIRKKVAEQGYGLDILVNDESPYVRAIVAEQGYGLDILANDKDPVIRDYAIKQLKSKELIQNETFEEKLDRLEKETELENQDITSNRILSQER